MSIAANPLPISCKSAADEKAVVRRGALRVSVLLPGVVRIEHDPAMLFEDRPSQHFWHRGQPVPEFSAHDEDGFLRVETSLMILRVPLGGVPSPEDILIRLKSPDSSGEHALTDCAGSNLGGSLRTLDTVRGRWDYKAGRMVQTEPGLMTRDGWTWVDDSETLVFDEAGILTLRRPGAMDLYVMAYGDDYAGALRDYHAVAGAPPLLPRYVLGLWWSRWEPYKQADLERIVDEFESHDVPLSVCVVDMDWHLPGWTGYTWNKEFFPDPRGFFEGLHRRGVHACMNLHPAGGVAKHEAAYEAMARHMGVDPATGKTVEFDITDPRFIEGYFKHLHHPLEADGVDFWWMDWQQGTKTPIPGLDPLWYLNHLHPRDLARDGTKRPLGFSRWGGWGAHRYPIGFSGDSSRVWDTLSFEIELTAQSSNSAFGWWSHEVGGFCDGFPDEELFTRWVQFGVLSPVFRLHNCGDPTLDYRPWTKEEKFREPCLAALRFRRALVPYIYTASHRNSLGAPPPCLPMYYGWPEAADAFHCPGQYMFGPSLLAAPHDAPAAPDTNLARKVVWMPPGEWFNFFDGTCHEGGRWTSIHGGLDEIPLFARGGHAIPMQGANAVEWVVFPGEGTSEFYDDDGETMDHTAGACATVSLSQKWRGESECVLRLERTGDARFGHGPFRLRLRGFGDAAPACGSVEFKREEGDWVSAPVTLDDTLTVSCSFDRKPDRKRLWTAERFWKLMHTFHINCHAVRQMAESKLDFAEDLQRIAPYLLEFTDTQIRTLAEEALGCGVHCHKASANCDVLVWWNHARRPDFDVRLSRSVEWLKYLEIRDRGDTSGQLHVIDHKEAQRGWNLRANFAGLTLLETANDKTGRK
mgnify:CR=1 FL=1